MRVLFLFIPALLEQPFAAWFQGVAGHPQLDKQFASSPQALVQRSGPETASAFDLLFPSWLRACWLASRRYVTRDICCVISSEPCGAQLCWTASWEEPVAADMTPPGPLTGSERYYKITTSSLFEHHSYKIIIKLICPSMFTAERTRTAFAFCCDRALEH